MVLAAVSVNFVKINKNSNDENKTKAFEAPFTNMALNELANRASSNKIEEKMTLRKIDTIIGFIYLVGVTAYSVLFFISMSV